MFIVVFTAFCLEITCLWQILPLFKFYLIFSHRRYSLTNIFVVFHIAVGAMVSTVWVLLRHPTLERTTTTIMKGTKEDKEYTYPRHRPSPRTCGVPTQCGAVVLVIWGFLLPLNSHCFPHCHPRGELPPSPSPPTLSGGAAAITRLSLDS